MRPDRVEIDGACVRVLTYLLAGVPWGSGGWPLPAHRPIESQVPRILGLFTLLQDLPPGVSGMASPSTPALRGFPGC